MEILPTKTREFSGPYTKCGRVEEEKEEEEALRPCIAAIGSASIIRFCRMQLWLCMEELSLSHSFLSHSLF